MAPADVILNTDVPPYLNSRSVPDCSMVHPAPMLTVLADIACPDTNSVPAASGSDSVRSVLVLGAAMVSVPVPLALPDNAIFDNLCSFQRG